MKTTYFLQMTICAMLFFFFAACGAQETNEQSRTEEVTSDASMEINDFKHTMQTRFFEIDRQLEELENRVQNAGDSLDESVMERLTELQLESNRLSQKANDLDTMTPDDVEYQREVLESQWNGLKEDVEALRSEVSEAVESSGTSTE